LRGIFVRPRGQIDVIIERVVCAEAAGQKLCAEHPQMGCNRKKLCLSMQMRNGGCLVATCDEVHCGILNKLKFGNIRRLGVWIPDGNSVVEHRLYQRLVGDK
jgi:hypothetical protein